MEKNKVPPLKGLKVIEMGTLIAGPFASRLLAEFGAEVIKIESPDGGDPLRQWRKLYEGTSLWWYVQARNKKSITVNLKEKEGQEIVRRLVKEADIVIENFRPGMLEQWSLGWEQLSAINPKLIMARLSGYGQTGPYRDRPGFGAIGESMGGIRFLTGYPDRAPVRVGVSLGDSLAGMYAVIGVLMAVYHRDVNGGKGQFIDVALYESVFSLMESLLPEYDMFGFVRERTGGSLPGIVPSNTYQCADGKYVVIGANSDSIFKRMMQAIGRDDLANDAQLARNDGRVPHTEKIDQAIAAWTKQNNLENVLNVLNKAEVPASKIYDIADIVNDVHYQARDMIQQFEINDSKSLKLPGIVPKMSETPGGTNGLGPKLGEHTFEVLSNLGYDQTQQADLKARGII